MVIAFLGFNLIGLCSSSSTMYIQKKKKKPFNSIHINNIDPNKESYVLTLQSHLLTGIRLYYAVF